MSTSRAASQAAYKRNRSNTTQSVVRNAQPLVVGDANVLNSWVHDTKESTCVIFNQSCWPGVAEGDMLRVSGGSDNSSRGFLFVVPKDEGVSKPQLQISVPRPLAEKFDIRAYGEVTVTKVEELNCKADYVEFIFQEQYLGRNDMWRLGEHLVGQCIHTDQEVSFIGAIAAKIQNIYINGKKVSAAQMTTSTKAIYRSLSAKVTIFIQVCRELWEFAGDGERYNEKIVHSFLPELFSKWREAGTTHTVNIVLISRVHYDKSEIDYAAGPLRQDDEGRWYKDFFKVITDLEIINEWKPTLVSLKNSFWDFQRDILLTHHYHRTTVGLGSKPEQVRLVGELSYAHDGPILEAIGLGLNPTESHYVDRSLSMTGVATIVITPGTGFYRVSKRLLRLTTSRMLDQGFGLDLVSLARPPLHQTPIFCFQRVEPEPRSGRDGKIGSKMTDPLWDGDDDLQDGVGTKEKSTYWWEPFWMSISFWNKQMDLPFREDRFVAQAKMHEIQMLGILEHDVLSSIEVPFLPNPADRFSDSISPKDHFVDSELISKEDADRFDNDVFALEVEHKAALGRSSSTSSTTTTLASSYRSVEKRGVVSHRNSIVSSRFNTIEESPRQIIMELPSDGVPGLESVPLTRTPSLSTSPSQLSIRSNRSTRSPRRAGTPPLSREVSTSSRSVKSKFAPTWLFDRFRSGPVEPQTSPVIASVKNSSSPTSTSNLTLTTPSPVRVTPSIKPTTMQSTVSHSPKPMTIKNTPTNWSHLGCSEDEPAFQRGNSYVRRSPVGTPPREGTRGKRRSGTINSIAVTPLTTSIPSPPRPNPSRPQSTFSGARSMLARRWQHMFPQVSYKHEIKWKSIVTPGCLPLTVEHFPTSAELASSYDMFAYDTFLDPGDMHSFLVHPTSAASKDGADGPHKAWALQVIRGMAAVRLAQGFQFVLKPQTDASTTPNQRTTSQTLAADPQLQGHFGRTKSFAVDDEITPKPLGAAEILRSTANDPIYLSMSNEIHRISYTGEGIQVRRYVKRMPVSRPYEYQCLIWPKLGVGYTELSTTFRSDGLENFGWNRLDMLVSGYEHQFNESLRYWRTRFVIIPAEPRFSTGPNGEKLNDEEMRLLGMDKLAEIFTKLRWQPPEEKANRPWPPVRFLPTTLDPASSVLDEQLMAQLDDIHAAGPLRKNVKSEKEIGEMSLGAIAKMMREEGMLPIKEHYWRKSVYPDSFTGFDLVSWLVREFRDVSSRAQGADWGTKLFELGLFEHCRQSHGFLDGHYFYRLKGEYAVLSTPRRWFSARKEEPHRSGFYPPGVLKNSNSANSGQRKNRRRLILSQTMVIDIDPNKKSDQAESVILHHDIIHNPSTVFHFELQWIGTTARCIEDQIRQWARTIDRYGLKLVEAYVSQICDIRERNAFQSCFPISLALPPPALPSQPPTPSTDSSQPNLPLNTPYHSFHFEYALLKKFGFILDIEAANLYSERVDVVYSYRREPVRYSQFVHRTGVAFAQVLDEQRGFLFLTNRLMVSAHGGRGITNLGAGMSERGVGAGGRLSNVADELRLKLSAFCSDAKELSAFYEEEILMLGRAASTGPEEPPPLSI